MSVTKWAYTSRCDGETCIGDCDRCPKSEYIYEEGENGEDKIQQDEV